MVAHTVELAAQGPQMYRKPEKNYCSCWAGARYSTAMIPTPKYLLEYFWRTLSLTQNDALYPTYEFYEPLMYFLNITGTSHKHLATCSHFRLAQNDLRTQRNKPESSFG